MAAERSHTADERVRLAVAPTVESAGLFLEDVRVTPAGSRTVVRVTLDLPQDEVGSLDSDRLAEASRSVSAAMDETDAVRGQYTLEVSTPGATRPLNEPRHYRRARTRTVRLTMVDGTEISGRLRDVSGGDGDGAEDVMLVFDDGRQVPLVDVRRGKVEVELKRLEDEDAGTSREGEGG